MSLPASSPGTLASMRANRGRDTRPELAVRRILHAHGLRYRINMALDFDARRRADITFTRAKLIVFIDGCFWHGCPTHYTAPVTQAGFWAEKRAKNMARDQETTSRLEDEGWSVLRFWEHESPAAVAAAIEAMYNDRTVSSESLRKATKG